MCIRDSNKPASFYENTYLELAEKLRGAVKLPIAFKLGNHFTNVLWIIRELYFRKINGVVLFNRFYEPDIDINKMKMVSSEVFSHASDIRTSLRWVALSSNKVPNMSIAASTGIQTGEAVIKMLLAGASATQVCSSIYKGGPAVIAKMVEALESWMATNHYKAIEDFRGKLSYSKIPDPAAYERSQFMRYFSSME
jgi:dihydroorotate dehydrogenase (fumarate)